LAAIHDLGLIHRDIKPGNIWLERDVGRVKILDFGLARGTRRDIQFTQEGSILGSLAYMAPEQANRKPIDGVRPAKPRGRLGGWRSRVGRLLRH
jgi:serine/threonine protein kinase